MDNTTYCQSCGMPLTDEQLGTEKDGSKNMDYCTYCYKDGGFTSDITMQEMIDFCVGPTVENTDMNEEQARKMMEEIFPKMKRWRV